MKLAGITCVLLAAMPLSFGASKEIIELQRDVAQLQDQLRTTQKTLDQLTVLTQQALDVGNRSNTSLAVMESKLTDATKRVQDGVSAPLMSVGTKMENMSEDYRNLRETVTDLASRMGKLDAKITDLINIVSLQVRPPAPPPPGTENQGTPGTAPPATSGPQTPPAGLKSERLYSDGVRDYTGGTYDVALSEFMDYVKYFNETIFAPNAQFYIGSIYYKKQDYPNALQAFDAVLEHYSDNPKTAAAHFWKGKTLLSMGKRDAAAKEFREVVNKYPSSDVVQAARTELRNLGLSSGPGTGAPPKGRSRHR